MPYVGQTITEVFPTSISVDTATIATANISNQLTDANMSAGSVIQTIQTFKNDVFATSSTSYVDVTGLTASITPSSSSNKILVLLRTTQSVYGDGFIKAKLLRGSTDIAVANGKDYFTFNYPSRSGTDTNIYIAHGSQHLDFLDSPSSTSSTTYKVQILAGSGQTAAINRGRDNDQYRGVSSITLMEIAV